VGAFVTTSPVPLVEAWSHADVDTGALWAASGARWLTDPQVGTPGRLVARTAGIIDFLDEHGAGLAALAGSNGLGLLSERAAMMGLPRADRRSCGGASRLLRCSDDWVVVSLARATDIELVPAWLEVEPPPTGDAWAVVERELMRRTSAEVVERAALLGLPCARVGEVGPSEAVRVTALGAATARPLDGAVVMNLASLWAGPLCADVLARSGARVITVESTRRPDGGRAAPRFFRALHERSESVVLDLTRGSEQARLRQLLLHADVVIEGSRPRALQQMGIDALELTASGPVVWVSITSHGRSDQCGERVGFGDDAAVAGGLVGWVGGEPRFVADAVADPLTGVTAAAAVVQLLQAGGRWLVDLALARVARSMVGEWGPRRVDIDPAQPRPRGGRHPRMPLGRDTDSVLAEFGIS
jgi:crotonobetainyl-CoA:carnitine CoA-transferase CaiB-like acyl-CoA transferase